MTHLTVNGRLNALLLHLDGAYAPNTLRAYRADMLEFIQYCDNVDACALPAWPSTVANFLMQAYYSPSPNRSESAAE